MSNSLRPLDCSLSGSSVHGVFQARILEWVAISSRGSFWRREQTHISCVFGIPGRFFTHWAIRECLTLCDPHGLYSPWNSPGQNTEVDSHSLLQGIFPTQGLNPGLLHCRCILYQVSHQGSPRILEWAAYPFSRGSSWPRNWVGVSCIADRFFTSWATREAHTICIPTENGGTVKEFNKGTVYRIKATNS